MSSFSAAAVNDMINLHERRVERVLAAWEQGRATSSSEGPHIAAWKAIGWLVNGPDATSFSRLVEADVAKAGPPVTFTDFINHYNRMLPKRAALFATNYQLGDMLGEGGFGTVVKGTRVESDETFALKCAQKSQLNERAMEGVESEIRLWMRVQHPGVCQCFDAFELSDQIVMVTELCPGGCLLDQISEADGFSEADAQHISRQVSDALVHLHRMGIAHRDIKPENVLCTDREPHKRGHVKLCDFGFATEFVQHESGQASTFTQLIGTAEYLAPEMVRALLKRRQGREAQGYTFKVDYWALGCLVYELLVGEPPFFSEDDEEQYKLTLEAPFPVSPEKLEGVSEGGILLLRALLERDPAARLGMDIHENKWISAGCLGWPLKANHLSVNGADPLRANVLVNRKRNSREVFKVRKRKRARRVQLAVLAIIRMGRSGSGSGTFNSESLNSAVERG